MQQTGGIFQTGSNSNFLIQGGQFVQKAPAQPEHKCYEADDGFKHLQAHVAPTAYATQQEGDAPKCHPNTRTAILNTIMDWVLMTTARLQWILWLNGAAGAGKSAIGRSVVDLCLAQKIVVVRFFFFRTDPTRNTIDPVIGTLVYQLIQSIPDLDAIITPKIRSNPLIFQDSFETQFRELIFESLKQLHNESPLEKPVVFLVDGVDECSGHKNQDNIIHTIARFVSEKLVPLIVIFASRTESQLRMAFDEPEVDCILRRLPLDTDYRAADDIRLFLDDSFSKIKRTHPFRSSIKPEWPTPLLLQEIVDKSSNQFIYASVVIKFISSSHLHPVQQLEIVRGLRPAGALTPFAQLDALYQHIFSQVHDITRVTEILAVAILGDFSYKQHVCWMLDITNDDIAVALGDLTSVISYDKDKITFLHASLPDFLLDQSRAQQYYIDKGLWCEQLAIKYLSQRKGHFGYLYRYLSQARCTPQLQDALYTFQPSNHWGFSDYSSDYVDIVHKMDFGDGGELYRHQLNLVVRRLHEMSPNWVDELKKNHDINGILDQIEHEKAVSRQTEVPVEGVTPWRVTRSSRKGLSKAPSETRFAPYHKRK